MYPIVSPRDLYQEYEARVTKAIRPHGPASELQPKPGMLTAVLARIEAWLTAAYMYPARYEVDEGGQLA